MAWPVKAKMPGPESAKRLADEVTRKGGTCVAFQLKNQWYVLGRYPDGRDVTGKRSDECPVNRTG